MRYIVYRDASSGYKAYTLHDGEMFQYFPFDGKVSSHVKIVREITTSTGASELEQVDLLTGEFCEEFDDPRKARMHAARLQGMASVMES